MAGGGGDARRAILLRIFEAHHDLPSPGEPLWCEIIDEVVTIALETHPAAQRLLFEAAGDAVPAAPTADELIRDVTACLLRFHPDADGEVVLDAGRVGAGIAARKADGAPALHETWKHALWAMYMRVLDPPSLQVFKQEPIAAAYVEGVGVAGDIFDVIDTGTAEERLTEGVRLVRLRMLMARYRVSVERAPKKGPAN